jgi:tRNA pseudouridine13 synthase
MLHNDWIIKQTPEDFIVSEVIIPSFLSFSTSDGKYTYLKLKKHGFTTFDAVKIVSEYLNVPVNHVTYSGLKDEDGLTEQSIAVLGEISVSQVESFNSLKNKITNKELTSKDSFLELSFEGIGSTPRRIGEILGNSFCITLRNLDKGEALKVKETGGKYSFYFINYYDTQRFGLPNKPHHTHLIGKSLLDKDYETAFSLLVESGNLTAEYKEKFHGESYKSFFDSLDLREVSFYKNSYSSYLWNNKLFNCLKEISDDLYQVEYSGLTYYFAKSPIMITQLMEETSELSMNRYFAKENQETIEEVFRSAVVQAIVHTINILEDDLNPSKWKATFAFFLPSGCYATMLIKQLMCMIQFAQFFEDT